MYNRLKAITAIVVMSLAFPASAAEIGDHVCLREARNLLEVLQQIFGCG